MPENKAVFLCIANATTEAVRKEFGPINLVGNEQMPAQIAVALLQLSLRYFADTKAPKSVVLGFFLDLMGVQGEKATIEEKPGGKLVLVPPSTSYIVADARAQDPRRKRR